MDWFLLKRLVKLGCVPEWWFLLVIVLSSAAMCYVVHLNRVAYAHLQKEYSIGNEIKVEWGQLLLQYGTLKSYERVHAKAQKKWGMFIPKSSQINLIKP